MDRSYWDKAAGDYESEIFQVALNDRKKLIPKFIKKFGGKDKVASDLGCGIGDFLPLLSDAFKHVTAVDISPVCLAQAKEHNADRDNISYVQKDLSRSNARLAKVNFTLSVNAILCSSMPKRARIFDLIVRHIKKGGHLLLVTPAIESKLLTHHRYVEWKKRSGNISTAERAMKRSSETRLAEGIAHLQSVPTKHFLREELITTLEGRGMKVLDIKKVEYSWETEFLDPPGWMKSPYPWDWLCVAEKM